MHEDRRKNEWIMVWTRLSNPQEEHGAWIKSLTVKNGSMGDSCTECDSTASSTRNGFIAICCHIVNTIDNFDLQILAAKT